MSNIKILTALEIPRIFPLMHAFVKEVGYPPLNEDCFKEFWSMLFSRVFGNIFYVEEAGVVIGILGALFAPDPVSGCLHAAEQFWFVREDHRKSRIGMELWNHFEGTARHRKCKRILMVGLANSKEEVLPKVYARRGYAPFEQIFMKELN